MDLREARSILGLSGPAGPDRLKAAFRRAARKFHPDRFQTFTEKAWATKRFIRARQAYEALRTAPAEPAAAPDPIPRAATVDLTPADVGIEIEIDPFRGYRTIANLLFLPVRLLVGKREDERAVGNVPQALVGFLTLVLTPSAIGVAAVLLPVVFVHFFLLGIGAAIDAAISEGRRRIADAIAGSHVFFLVEILVGGAVLSIGIAYWFFRGPLTTTEIVLGALIWGAPLAFLLMESAGFLRSALAVSR
jgi:hypothetical protein